MSTGAADPRGIGQGSAALLGVLRQSQARGFIGDGDLGDHLRHAEGFVEAVGPMPATALDLGSGGGIPGLVLAEWWPSCTLTLLDGSEQRAAFLAWAVDQMGVVERVPVVAGRAEERGRDPELRHSCEVVVARLFGAPAVVAECGAPFLRAGGKLVVSEPPGSDGRRWVADEALARLGLERGPFVTAAGAGFQILVAATACPETYPRRTGIPTKRPLF